VKLDVSLGVHGLSILYSITSSFLSPPLAHTSPVRAGSFADDDGGGGGGRVKIDAYVTLTLQIH
jgi:hypothetical protein